MSSRPPVFTWNEELHFGPSSEPIHIQTFVNDAQNLHLRGLWPWLESNPAKSAATNNITVWKGWQEVPEDVKASIEQDCDLGDLTSLIAKILSSPKHMHYLQTAHAEAVSQCGIALSQKKDKGKGKQPAAHDDPDLEELKNIVEHTPLNIWKLKVAARPYVRNGHVSDQNALDYLKLQPSDLLHEPSHFHETLITLTTYTRNTWYPNAFSRDSQHTLLSSNTLADVWSCVPCALRGHIPREVTEVDADSERLDPYMRPQEGRVVGYEASDIESDLDQVVVIVEGVAYSNSRAPLDYADRLLSHIEQFKRSLPAPDAPPPLPPGPYERPSSTTPLTKGLPLEAVQLRTLTLRINEPYWMLHRGSCEHWFVVDEVRLQNPRDPASGYPVGIQRTPVSRSLCRICSKVPASLSVLNDVRLGESPSMVCQPCWELFGPPPQPKEVDDLNDPVVIVPVTFEA